MSIFTNSKYKKTLTFVNSFYNKNKIENGMENKENNKNHLSQRKLQNYILKFGIKTNKNIERRNSMYSNKKIILIILLFYY